MDVFLTFLPGILAAYAILLVAASSPGPSVALLLGVGAAQGRAAAMLTTVGIAFGSVVLNALTLAGVGLLLEQAAWAFTALRVVGAAYLGWLAYGAFRKAANPTAVKVREIGHQTRGRLILTGFALQVTNPKAIVFWVAIHAVSGIALAPASVVAVFFVGAFAISFLCHGAWGVLFSSQAFRAAYAAGRRWIEAALGTFLAFMAFRLVTER
ncbi:LysE family translocator [Shimia ponticola]|uniref:LysE family translocator n=1 Tax=Shimia ponticola TaxID=2582893 RepID=UPI0011BFCCB2|nr:LysE family translocator [Shimia ponticola]